jgi:DNA polymerase-3 subunit gamma/tau
MALNGRRDLAFAPSPRAGFEMTVLRMLAFRPAEGDGARAASTGIPAATPAGGAPTRSASAMAREALAESPPTPAPAAPRQAAASDDPPWAREPAPAATVQAAPPSPPPPPKSAEPMPAAAVASVVTLPAGGAIDAEAWIALVAGSSLKGPARILAEHSTFVGYDDGVLRLSLPPEDELLKSSAMVKMMADALAPALGASPQIRFEGVAVQGASSLRERNERARDERQSAAESAFLNDPDVQRLMSQHGARLVADSIRPFDEP